MANKYVLLIIFEYNFKCVPFNYTNNTQPNFLPGSISDLIVIYNFVHSELKVPLDHIMIITDIIPKEKKFPWIFTKQGPNIILNNIKYPNIESMISSIIYFLNIIPHSSEILIYYSGHGISVPLYSHMPTKLTERAFMLTKNDCGILINVAFRFSQLYNLLFSNQQNLSYISCISNGDQLLIRDYPLSIQNHRYISNNSKLLFIADCCSYPIYNNYHIYNSYYKISVSIYNEFSYLIIFPKDMITISSENGSSLTYDIIHVLKQLPNINILPKLLKNCHIITNNIDFIPLLY